MNISQKAERTALVHQIERFSKSHILIYNSNVPDTSGRKTRRKRKQAFAKHYVFHAKKLGK